MSRRRKTSSLDKLAKRHTSIRWGLALVQFLGSMVVQFVFLLVKGIALVARSCWNRINKKKVSRETADSFKIKDSKEKFLPIALKPDVTFDDVVGLEDAKRFVAQRVVKPFLYPKEAKTLSVKREGGLLLVGPPGTGKSLLAMAMANEIDASFFHVKPNDIVKSAVGTAEQNISLLFEKLCSEKKAVLFLDDVDGLLTSRSKNPSTIMKRVISQYLIETDGLKVKLGNSSLFIIAATNEPWMIDPGILRSGRFDLKCYVGLPKGDSVVRILKKNIDGRPFSEDVNMVAIAQRAEERLFSGADLKLLVDQAAAVAFDRTTEMSGQPLAITMADFEEAFKAVRPSVSEKDIKRYQRWSTSPDN